MDYQVAAWGDSLTAGARSTEAGDYPNDLTRLLAKDVYNGGVGGETSTQIATRMVGSQFDALPTIIWAGRNNYLNPATVESDVARMVAAAPSGRYLVLSVLNTEGEGTGTTAYDDITAINSALATAYGAHYLDVRSYLVSLYDPGNTSDVTDHDNDIVPTSLRFDTGVHLINAGYQDVADYIYAHRAELGLP